ncbi:hypothetical protein RRG08_064729 [Elysia crispata]|uniref:Uncharacterized protein n=1 Tax=Elysia crispata TaxID=231223 RepID=A0AAE0YZE3_9GAST|nr:hypothetical protein RRG08_064729 [Elysia crispata]
MFLYPSSFIHKVITHRDHPKVPESERLMSIPENPCKDCVTSSYAELRKLQIDTVGMRTPRGQSFSSNSASLFSLNSSCNELLAVMLGVTRAF